MDGNAPTAPRRVTASDRRRRALELRMAGSSFADIGAALEISKQAAHQLVTAALRDIEAKTVETTDELRRLELERLDKMLIKVWQQVAQGNLGAVDRALRIMERRSRLLGLDAPTKTDITSGNAPLVYNVTWNVSAPADPDAAPDD